MFRIALFLLTSFATLGASAAIVLPALEDKPFTLDPMSPADMQAQIEKSKVSLAQAIEAATKSAGGVASSADMRVEGGMPKYSVIVYGGGKAQRVMIDATSGEVTGKTELARYPGDAVQGNLIQTPSGLGYIDIRPGTGEKPAGPETKVKVHYTGWTVDGKQFDSSVDKGQPADFALNRVIKGWTEGVGSMQVGGKRKLVIPYPLGWGESGNPPKIPPRATTIFDVELLEILK